ncbi:MAG: VanZ family protein [Alphaproteobacteria bacterium]|nr:VanZ family protein [Alphaproteobacteria bacterium]
MRKKIFLIIWGLSTGVILHLALSPSFGNLPLFVDKILHTSLAFVLMLGPIVMTKKPAIIYSAGVILILLGAAAEFVQSLTPDRSAEFYDVIANSVGTLLAFAFFHYLKYTKA